MAECILPLCGCEWGGAQRLTSRVANRLALSADARQGFADAMEDLCKSLSCQRTQGVAQSAVAKALRAGFPQAAPECINAALQKVFTGVAAVCPTFQQGLPAFVVALIRDPNFFTGVGDLAACLLGPAEATRARTTLNECLMTALGDFFRSLCANAGSLLTCQPAARAAFPCCCGGSATPPVQPAPVAPPQPQPAGPTLCDMIGEMVGLWCRLPPGDPHEIPPAAPSDGPIHREVRRC